MKDDAASTLDYSLAVESARDLEVRRIEANDRAVCKLEGAGPTQPRNKSVASHFANELVVARHSEEAVGSFKQVV